jgi:probable HAF family extracellular repeat protein
MGWFVPIEKMPPPVLSVVNDEGWQINGSGPEVHDTLRHYFGSHIPVEPSMASLFGNQLISDWLAPRYVKEIFGSMIGYALSAQTPSQRIEELYLNYRDYGAPSQGLDAASLYFFRRPINTLSESDARFLLARQTTISDPFIGSDSNRALRPALESPSQYDYDEFPVFVPNSNGVHHDGGVNRWGNAVGTAFNQDKPTAFSCYHDQQHVLGDLSSANGSWAISINDNDQSVGYSSGDDGKQHAVSWGNRGVVHDLGSLPGYSQSIARCINNKGQIVGYAYNPNTIGNLGWSTPCRAFLWQSGHMVNLGAPQGYLGSRAYAINDSGQIAGWVLTPSQVTHAMVWDNGRMQDIGTLGGEASIATAINNQGQVVGDSQRKNGTVVPFLWQSGVMYDLGTLGPNDNMSRALAINDSGVVVGYSYTAFKPFIWDGVHGKRDPTSLFKVDAKQKASLSHACTLLSINDAGQILGLTWKDPRYMFLLTPHRVAPAVKESGAKR